MMEHTVQSFQIKRTYGAAATYLHCFLMHLNGLLKREIDNWHATHAP